MIQPTQLWKELNRSYRHSVQDKDSKRNASPISDAKGGGELQGFTRREKRSNGIRIKSGSVFLSN